MSVNFYTNNVLNYTVDFYELLFIVYIFLVLENSMLYRNPSQISEGEPIISQQKSNLSLGN